MKSNLLLWFSGVAMGVLLVGSTGSAFARQGVRVSEPATAHQARRIINLLEVPKFGAAQVLDEHECLVSYMAKGTMEEAKSFFGEYLTKQGWQAMPHQYAQSPQYSDTTYHRDGFYVRVAIGEAGNPGALSVMLASLGNLDLRKLLEIPGISANAESTPVNAGGKIAGKIDEVAQAMEKRLREEGWQLTFDARAQVLEVPHYRSMQFRKNAVRVMAGVVVNPTDASGPLNVFVMAEPMFPFDIPVVANDVTLQLDLASFRSTQETTMTRGQVATWLQKQAAGYGWKVPGTEEFTNGSSPWLDIGDGTERALRVSLVEQSGKMHVAMERILVKPPATAAAEVEPPAGGVADRPNPTKGTSESMAEKDQSADEIGDAILKQVDAELKKAMDSLGGGIQPPSGQTLDELQSRAEKMLAQLDPQRASSDAKESAEMKKVAAVQEEDQLRDPADAAIEFSKCTMTLDGKKFELTQAVAFVRMEGDQEVRTIIFSDKPLKVKVLEEKLANGEDVYGFHLVASSASQLEVTLRGDSCSMSGYCGGLSVSTNSSQIMSTLTYWKGHLQGRASLADFELGEHTMSFELQAKQPALIGKSIED